MEHALLLSQGNASLETPEHTTSACTLLCSSLHVACQLAHVLLRWIPRHASSTSLGSESINRTTPRRWTTLGRRGSRVLERTVRVLPGIFSCAGLAPNPPHRAARPAQLKI